MSHISAQQLYSTVPSKNYINLDDPKETIDFLDFSRTDVSRATNQPKNSIRYDDRIPKEVKNRIKEIALTINMVAEFFEGDLKKTKQWFETVNPLLGHLSPREMIRYGRFEKLHKFIINARNDVRP